MDGVLYCRRATSNLYVLVQKRTPMATKYTDTVRRCALHPIGSYPRAQVSQLQKIQEFIMDLQDVTEEYERAMDAERSAAPKPSVSP